MNISVFLADDHRILRDGLRMLLEAQRDIRVAGEADDGRQAVGGILSVRPDIVLMDITMPELNGIEATRQIQEELPAAKVVILSVHGDSEHVYRAFQAGARGYLLKESAGPEVVEAVRTVHAGRRYLSHKLIQAGMDEYIYERQKRSPIDQLSGREREVCQLTVEGHTSAAIAEKLGLSPKTVETYRSRVMEKLGVEDITGLVRYAISNGLTPLG
ncbi:MAG: response regulator transcription factor [Anaerolineales bacterium]